jgi:hypothetical protein
MKPVWLVSDGGDTYMPDWYLKEKQREVAALREFHSSIVSHASKDPNPYTRALAIANNTKNNAA